MSKTLDKIRQTCRTILFEEFSHPSDETANSLYSLMDKALASGTFGGQEFYREIEESLMVKSFDEFLQKFGPKIYEYVYAVNNVPTFGYTADKKEAEGKSGILVDMVSHPFFTMLERMYTQKGTSGQSNLDFPEDNIKAELTPKAQMKKVYDMRRKIRGLAIDYEKAKKANQNALPYAQGLRKCREEISEKFEQSPRALLALGITETEDKIKNTREKIELLDQSNSEVAPGLAGGRLCFNEDGSLGIRAISVAAGKDFDEPDQLALEDKAVRKVLALVENDVRESDIEDEFSKELIISAYAPKEITRGDEAMDLPALKGHLEALESRKKQYETVYRQAQEAFIETMAPIAQKLLDVLAFFDHASEKGGKSGVFPAGLIVANCNIASFLRDTESRKNFTAMMHRLGHETNGKKTWLGILPDVAEREDVSAAYNEMSEDELMGPLNTGKRNPGSASGANDGDVTLATAKPFWKIMEEANILTVFNFKPEEANSFGGLTESAVEKMEEVLKDMDNPHAVLAYPNFTIMREGTVKIAENGEPVRVPAICVSSSYVAAGLIAASQQPKLLETKDELGKKLLSDTVCTRVDLEDEDLVKNLTTKFNRELAFSWPDEITRAIGKRRFGFVFCSDYKLDQENHKSIENTYVLQASTMGRQGDKYQPVYYTLTQDFINNYLRYFGKELTEEQLAYFLNNDVQEWVRESERGQSIGKLNLILRAGESIVKTGTGENTTLEIILKGGKLSFRPNIKTKTMGDN